MSIMHGRDKEKHSYTELLDTIANLSETAEFDTPENWYQTVFGKEFPGKLREEEKTPENDETPKGNQASGKAENQAEKPAKTIPEKEQNHTLHTGGTQEKEESGENPSTVAPEKGENNENPKGNQPLGGLADITEEKCPYCCGSKEIYSINYAFFISLSLSGEGKIGKISAPQEHDTIQFEYCPRCGRKLKK